VATLAVAAVLFWVLARLVRSWVEREMSRRRIRPEVALLVSRAAFVAVVVVALFVVVGFATRNGGVAVTGVLIATVLASLGIQDILRSYVSGIYLLSERRLTAGDEIEFGTFSGTIVEIKLRVTYVRGPEGALIIVPNSELFNNTVVVRSNRNVAEGDRPPVPAAAVSRKPRA
jgi:small-conductance mechanosensitive channel